MFYDTRKRTKRQLLLDDITYLNWYYEFLSSLDLASISQNAYGQYISPIRIAEEKVDLMLNLSVMSIEEAYENVYWFEYHFSYYLKDVINNNLKGKN